MKSNQRQQRWLEIIPGLLAWSVLLLPIVFSIWWPRGVAYVVILFELYWLIRSVHISSHLIRGYRRLRKGLTINWPKKLSVINKKLVREVYHVVVVCTYKEDYKILNETIKAVAGSDYEVKKNVILVLGCEEREGEEARAKAQRLEKKYKSHFKHWLTTYHPDGVVGEVMGKGPNINYAFRQLEKSYLKPRRFDPKKVIVTTFDADGVVHPHYLAQLTYRFLTREDAQSCSYQPVPLYYNNLFEVPAISRIVAWSASFWQMIEASRSEEYLRIFSCYSIPLPILRKANYWAVDNPVEDGVQYWRNFVAMNGKYRVVPIYSTVSMDAVQSETYGQTLRAQYVQLRRWATGASDIAWVLPRFIGNRKIAWGRKWYSFVKLVESHLSWATAPLILLLAANWPTLLNADFASTVFGYNLHRTASGILTLTLVGISATLIINVLLIPARYKRKMKYTLTTVWPWVLVPIMTIFYGALPALEAQTRMIFNKKIQFIVTEKKRG